MGGVVDTYPPREMQLQESYWGEVVISSRTPCSAYEDRARTHVSASGRKSRVFCC